MAAGGKPDPGFGSRLVLMYGENPPREAPCTCGFVLLPEGGLPVDMLHAEPCTPFVGAVEDALLKEVDDDPAVAIGFALALFFQYVAYLCHDGFLLV